eukprot:4934361-Pleurochrysis_carterae.AAC.1
MISTISVLFRTALLVPSFARPLYQPALPLGYVYTWHIGLLKPLRDLISFLLGALAPQLLRHVSAKLRSTFPQEPLGPTDATQQAAGN